ncbi:MAG: hypothetical protein JXR96_11590 [Deltaproteobacteria bacterium]|nr:hypothetical protein [Deltaproteobacteria bacterium]
MRGLVFSLIGLCLALPASVWADEAEVCPPLPEAIPRGLNVHTSLGPALWLGDVGSYSQVGLAFRFGAGYELLPWVGLEAVWTTGHHATDQPAPPAPGTFTTHALHAVVKANLPLERFDLFAKGGFGMQWSKPDILVRVEGFDGQLCAAWLAGLGFAWHTPRKHVWLGAEVAVFGAIDFPGYLLSATGVLGFTL